MNFGELINFAKQMHNIQAGVPKNPVTTLIQTDTLYAATADVLSPSGNYIYYIISLQVSPTVAFTVANHFSLMEYDSLGVINTNGSDGYTWPAGNVADQGGVEWYDVWSYGLKMIETGTASASVQGKMIRFNFA